MIGIRVAFHTMRWPTRTRRLWIDAVLSFVAFLAVVVAGTRSFWVWDAWGFGNGTIIGLEGGCVLFTHQKPILQPPLKGPLHGVMEPAEFDFPGSILGFVVAKDLSHNHAGNPIFGLQVPLWPLLLLLVVIPIRWLIALPANAPAFPVIACTKSADPAQ